MNSGFQRTMEDARPKAEMASAPIALVMLFALMFYGAAVYLNGHGGGFNALVYQPYRSYDELVDVQPPRSSQGPVTERQFFIATARCAIRPTVWEFGGNSRHWPDQNGWQILHLIGSSERS